MTFLSAAGVEALWSDAPENYRAALPAVREWILGHLPEGYEEVVDGSQLNYQVPLERFPDTYNRRPLLYLSLGPAGRHAALYLYPLYMDPARTEAFLASSRAAGKQPDLGKACLRFRALEDLDEESVTEVIGALPVDAFIELYRSVTERRPRRRRANQGGT